MSRLLLEARLSKIDETSLNMHTHARYLVPAFLRQESCAARSMPDACGISLGLNLVSPFLALSALPPLPPPPPSLR